MFLEPVNYVAGDKTVVLPTVRGICIFFVFESAPALHLASSLALTRVYFDPAWLLPDNSPDMILELLPARKIRCIACRTSDDQQKVTIPFFPACCEGHDSAK